MEGVSTTSNSVKGNPPTKRKGSQQHQLHAELSKPCVFDSLTALMNQPLEILLQTVVVNNNSNDDNHKAKYTNKKKKKQNIKGGSGGTDTYFHSLGSDVVQHFVNSPSSSNDDLTACRISTTTMVRSFLFRAYELFHLNIIDGSYLLRNVDSPLHSLYYHHYHHTQSRPRE